MTPRPCTWGQRRPWGFWFLGMGVLGSDSSLRAVGDTWPAGHVAMQTVSGACLEGCPCSLWAQREFGVPDVRGRGPLMSSSHHTALHMPPLSPRLGFLMGKGMYPLWVWGSLCTAGVPQGGRSSRQDRVHVLWKHSLTPSHRESWPGGDPGNARRSWVSRVCWPCHPLDRRQRSSRSLGLGGSGGGVIRAE